MISTIAHGAGAFAAGLTTLILIILAVAVAGLVIAGISVAIIWATRRIPRGGAHGGRTFFDIVGATASWLVADWNIVKIVGAVGVGLFVYALFVRPAWREVQHPGTANLLPTVAGALIAAGPLHSHAAPSTPSSVTAAPVAPPPLDDVPITIPHFGDGNTWSETLPVPVGYKLCPASADDAILWASADVQYRPVGYTDDDHWTDLPADRSIEVHGNATHYRLPQNAGDEDKRILLSRKGSSETCPF